MKRNQIVTKNKHEEMQNNQTMNYYTKIEDEDLNIIPNPNYDLHNLQIPFRAVVVAPSGSGKTNFIVDLIKNFCTGKKGTFKSIIVVTMNKDEPLYNMLEKNGVEIREGIIKIPDLDKYNKSEGHLLIFDDLVMVKKQDIIASYYIRCRKMNVSAVYLSQRYYPIHKMIRENCNYLFVLKMGNIRDIKLIMNEFSLGVTKEQLLNMYKYATKGKFNVLTIDKEITDDNKKFRKNFLEYFNPDDF